MGMGFAPTWLRQMSPLLHMITLTTAADTHFVSSINNNNNNNNTSICKAHNVSIRAESEAPFVEYFCCVHDVSLLHSTLQAHRDEAADHAKLLLLLKCSVKHTIFKYHFWWR